MFVAGLTREQREGWAQEDTAAAIVALVALARRRTASASSSPPLGPRGDGAQ